LIFDAQAARIEGIPETNLSPRTDSDALPPRSAGRLEVEASQSPGPNSSQLLVSRKNY